jgi:hypothetical protein
MDARRRLKSKTKSMFRVFFSEKNVAPKKLWITTFSAASTPLDHARNRLDSQGVDSQELYPAECCRIRARPRWTPSGLSFCAVLILMAGGLLTDTINGRGSQFDEQEANQCFFEISC